MSESRSHATVGVFVVGCLILLGLLLLAFNKGAGVFAATYTLRLRTGDVGGLKARSAVLMAGVPVGHVTRAELDPDGRGVTVLLKLHKRHPIHRDAKFVIEQIGLLGDQFVVIQPGANAGPLLKDGDEVRCEPPFNLQELARSTVGFIQRVDQMARTLNEALTRVNTLVLNESTLTNFTTGIGNFRRLSDRALGLADNLDRLLSSNAPPVSVSVSNFARFSDDLNRLAGDLRQTVSENRGELQTAMKNLEQSSQSLNELARDLQAGRGVAGSLLKDATLQANFSNTLAHLSVASSNLARYGLLYKPKPPKETDRKSTSPSRKSAD
jgi:phospholipid/cholesterol/gamma-HCH transport system substrate-binding protein